jgi:hypothetical protein
MSEITEAIVNQAIAAYNRGLSDGQAIEQERIIKLLEALAYIDEAGHEMIGEFKADLIAAIKGEQK